MPREAIHWVLKDERGRGLGEGDLRHMESSRGLGCRALLRVQMALMAGRDPESGVGLGQA